MNDNVQAIADDFTAMCKAGDFEGAGEKYWAPDVRSVEPMEGDMADIRGLDAVRGKGKWWYDNHEVHSVVVTGPFVNHDQFVVDFEMDVTAKAEGRRMHLKESALYTVKGGKIVEERFFMRS
jgi:hypothetical protein